MNLPAFNLKYRSFHLFTLVLSLLFTISLSKAMATANQTNGLTEKNESIISAKKINPTTIEIQLSGHHKMLIDFMEKTYSGYSRTIPEE
jgi:hypothetical protein